MQLFFRKEGTGDPLVILHGLYGSADNWMGIARKLAACRTA
jgi:esterase